LGHSLNSKRNSEIVIVDMDLFLNIVEYLNEDKQNEIYSGIMINENSLRKSKEQKEFVEEVLKNIGNFGKEVAIGIIINLVKP